MLIANINGRRVHARSAKSGDIGICPFTRAEVKAHVGPFRQYWAYVGGAPALPEGYERETPWHYAWKHLIQDENCEVVFGENREHRADIVGANGTIIELQHSPIDARIADERSAFYSRTTGERVVWVIDAYEFADRIILLPPEKGARYGKVQWKNPRLWAKFIAGDSDTHAFLDPKFVGDCMMKIWRHDGSLYGFELSKRDFFMKYLSQVAKPEYADFRFNRYEVWKIYDTK